MQFIVYTKRGCPWCEDLLDFLRTQPLPFEEREVRSSKPYFDEMIALSGQSKAPTVLLDGVVYADTDVDAIKAALSKITTNVA